MLSYTTATDLNLIQIKLNAVKTGQSTPVTTENLEAKYPRLFDGIGKLKVPMQPNLPFQYFKRNS